MRTDLQFLQEAFSLFANLICSSADLNGNGLVKAPSGQTPQEALFTRAQYGQATELARAEQDKLQ
jgi:hypothetical protein